jgi:hypothetical protein
MEKKEKQIRIGKITFGIVMILIGVVIFLQTLTNLEVVRYVLMLWPLVLVILGIETLIYRNRENIKYDLAGAIFTLIIVGMVTVFSIINYGVNKVLYDSKVQDVILNNIHESETTYSTKDKLNLTNFKDNNKINVVINTIPSVSETTVKIRINNDLGTIEEKISSTKTDITDYIFFDEEKSEMTLLKGFDNFKNIDVLIITSNPNNIAIN